MKLPARPLLSVWARTAVDKGYVGRSQQVGDNQGEGFDTFCRVIGLHENAYYRAQRTGWVSLAMADKITIALGLHPILVWPAEYNAWLGAEPPLTDNERASYERWEASRDLQRQHQKDRNVA